MYANDKKVKLFYSPNHIFSYLNFFLQHYKYLHKFKFMLKIQSFLTFFKTTVNKHLPKFKLMLKL